jgi:hypothetical protein
LPGLTRQSVQRRSAMDARVKPGHDGTKGDCAARAEMIF